TVLGLRAVPVNRLLNPATPALASLKQCCLYGAGESHKQVDGAFPAFCVTEAAGLPAALCGLIWSYVEHKRICSNCGRWFHGPAPGVGSYARLCQDESVVLGRYCSLTCAPRAHSATYLTADMVTSFQAVIRGCMQPLHTAGPRAAALFSAK